MQFAAVDVIVSQPVRRHSRGRPGKVANLRGVRQGALADAHSASYATAILFTAKLTAAGSLELCSVAAPIGGRSSNSKAWRRGICMGEDDSISQPVATLFLAPMILLSVKHRRGGGLRVYACGEKAADQFQRDTA
jgi:hypothetical protein